MAQPSHPSPRMASDGCSPATRPTSSPICAPCQSGDIFLPDDVDRVDVRLGRFDLPNSLIADLAEAAGKHGLTVLIDVILDRVAVDGAMARAHPELFGPPDERAGVLDP